jgi:hypothetical protein
MATKQEKQQPAEQKDKQAQQNLSALVGHNVMHTLGQPGNLQRVQVRQLWEDHYRVNILVGADAASVTVAHSYFLVTDSKGSILAATPKITKKY